MADADPIDPNRPVPMPRPITTIWSRRWLGFPATPPPPIGRGHDVATLRALVLEPRRRLVTVTGPGGVGKTRLAQAVAEDVAPEFADGAAFVALAAINDPAALLPAIARVLEVRETPGRPLRDTLTGALRDRHLLLVLDNFEQLVAPAATTALAALLQGCTGLTLLVTSREPLRLHDERLFATPALALPATTSAPDAATLMAYGAVALFVERARLAQHGFALTTENAPAVVEICRRLDGLPLAIELAASWIRVLPPSALLARLEPRLPLLRGGGSDQPARLRTMRDAIAWSYDLLTVEEQRFFRSLAVFAGGFTLDAAEAVGGRGGAGGVAALRGKGTTDAAPSFSFPPLPPAPPERSDSPSALDLLARLIDKSLVQIGPNGAEARYALLETVREFAMQCLVESGEAAAIEAAHASHYLTLAEAAARAAGSAESGAWMRRLGAERPNLWAALDWLETSGQSRLVLQMTGALWHYWYRLGDLTAGRGRLERALAAAPPDVDPILRARALRGAGVLAWQSADHTRSRQRLEAALLAYDALGDRTGAAWVRNSLGCLFATLSEAEQAEAFLTESLHTFRELGDVIGAAQLTTNLGELAGVEGKHELAIARLEAAVAMWNDLGDSVGAVRAEVYLAQALLARDELGRAEAVLLNALATIRDIDYEQILPAALRTVAHLAARRGDAAAAARWYGAEDGLREMLGMELTAARWAGHARIVAGLRQRLGEPAFATAWMAGRGLSAAQAVEDVLTSAGAMSVAGPQRVARSGPLTSDSESDLSQRERQVLTLLIDGRSDREIAAALFISQRTASTHVGSILRKLNASTRAEAAVRAVRDGLV